MEGILLKWTNYVSGWQQRYFILDDGVLSYYRSKEEMNSGCKGSVKLSVCDVIGEFHVNTASLLRTNNAVHSSDPRRFDLILGEQRYYLRALSRADRQRWVIALGSSKVGTAQLKSEDVNIYEPSQTQLIDNHRSELRLYHNLMVQQVKEIQSELKEGTVPDMNRIDELTGMLNASCSTFLITLDELMILSNAQAPWLSSIVTGTTLETSPTIFRNTPCLTNTDPSNIHSPNMRQDWVKLNYTIEPIIKKDQDILRPRRILSNNNLCSSLTNDPIFRNSHAQSSLNRRHFNATRKYQTFFSTLEYSFEEIKPSIPIQPIPDNDNEIKLPGDYLSALEFVKASKCLLHFLDRLNNNTNNQTNCKLSTTSRTFIALQQIHHRLLTYLNCIELHVEMHTSTTIIINDHHNHTTDMNTTVIGGTDENLSIDNKQNHHDTNVDNHCNILFKKAQLSLGYLLRYEVKHKESIQENNNSVYMAILWLCRWLNFVREFIHHLFCSPDPSSLINNTLSSDTSLVTIANEAYTRCLRPFHSWSVRGMAMVSSHLMFTFELNNRIICFIHIN
ncbi:unnamed protein product [Schistosoma margrebowiei]|uniref:Pleckstrin homology domain-containing family A member 8 n=1 Tax=Schistosoma margrebowiei TaxID=48269 RepID=A0A183L8S3_9TREM|nr:unnamed protein product [Schistosoma margrebowiei]